MTLRLSNKLSDLFDDEEEEEEPVVQKVPVQEVKRLDVETVDEEVNKHVLENSTFCVEAKCRNFCILC